MGGIYGLNEQETNNFPPVVFGCVMILCTTYYKTALVESDKNSWIDGLIFHSNSKLFHKNIFIFLIHGRYQIPFIGKVSRKIQFLQCGIHLYFETPTIVTHVIE